MDRNKSESAYPQSFAAFKFCIFLLLVVGVVAIMVWAKSDGPFKRIELSLKTATSGTVNCLVVLPKPMGKHPVVIYLQDAGGSLLGSENELRQFAELGLAAVSLEYDQTNQSVFDEQFIALRQFLQQQFWAQTNATAWVGFSLGAQRTLNFALRHHELQPQLLVSLGGGRAEELDEKSKIEASQTTHPNLNTKNPTSKGSGLIELPSSPGQSAAAGKSQPATWIHCPVLLANGEQDEIFAVEDVRRLAGWLRSQGAVVETETLTNLSHNFGEDRGVVMRAVAEYCTARLALPDYTADLYGCQLNVADRERFNRAMQRAGQRRPELWHAVTAALEPERDTMMNVIGGLEDYDLAHISAAQLKKSVYNAWRARRKYPWCRDTPVEIFDRFVANTRIYEEPLEDWSDPYGSAISRVVKYCHTTAEASDALWGWMRVRALESTTARKEQPEVLSLIRGGCEEFSVAFTGLARTVGLPVRPAWTFWPTIGNRHFWNEVWSVEERQWHAFDTSALNRSYDDAHWMTWIPKSVIQVPTGERGAWHAVADQRWESLTNSIGLFYPSGQVLVRVLDGGEPASGQRVGVQVWLGNGMGGKRDNAVKYWEPEVFTIAAAITDQKGEARLVLGQSAEQPYRIFLDTLGKQDWQWLSVRSNRTYVVILETGKHKPFDIKATPPSLSWLKDETRETR